MSEAEKSGKNYIGYDYKSVTVPGGKASLYLDAYENFGWIPDDMPPAGLYTDMSVIKLKRDRKIVNKTELTRLQRHFEACMDEISALEHSRTKMATVYSIAAGLLGTAFLAGAVFAVTAAPPLILLCAILGIPGILGWALPYQIYKKIAEKRAAAISPLIEQKYDEAHDICEKGNALIH